MPEDFEAYRPLVRKKEGKETELIYGPLKIGKRGDSFTVTIPSDLAERMDLKEGGRMEFSWDEVSDTALMEKEDEDVVKFGSRRIRKTESGPTEVTIPAKLARNKMKVERKKKDRKEIKLIFDKETNIIRIEKGRTLR
ncbi:hypothetical protein AKJ36_00020 [candidate division MSBL1 archaeon SCGC-AAA259I07]|uniref:SpoVT-AbrB domain-containing protein n=1 Tax=candidate division MSBL1 archaeon SCGC-AAA259I07 TaxID=1698266 RepID=A0A133UN24_9EURY|nr:hypothetical protein AKJ36_00020 [candidate division MSBL1 archaeon SCGC-AAA259I07]